MAEKPILFGGDMVKAILDGRKTQTRRVIKRQPTRFEGGASETGKCPYGKSGNTLWVRETWATPGNYDHIKPSDLSVAYWGDIVYRASEQYPAYYKWRSSIFMPRWASRITLKVADVRHERLQDISEEDAKAEGVFPFDVFSPKARRGNDDYITPFMQLWDSINAKRGYGWNANPWVWVVEFEAVQNG